MPTGTRATTAWVPVSMTQTAPGCAIASWAPGAMPLCTEASAIWSGSPLLVTQANRPSGDTCTLCGIRPTRTLASAWNDVASSTLTVSAPSLAT